jgi:Do/DeqQ family serine protease
MSKGPTRFLPAAAAVVGLAVGIPFVTSAIQPYFTPTKSTPITVVPRAEAAIPVREGMPTLAPLIEKVTPAVVNVAVKAKAADVDLPNNVPEQFRRFFEDPRNPNQLPRQREANSAGSGVIVDAAKGYIMTNYHVIDKAAEITVTLKDRREITAKLIGGDEGTDIALLQIDAKGLQDIPLGDSADLRVGDYVVAIGNPFGLAQTVTSGIVSAMGRSGMNIENYEDFIQTDASINPGNSGGALINLKGELVGINTAIIGPSGGNVGIGFAVPMHMAKAVMNQLIEHGEVRRGRLGIQISNLSPDLAANLGISESDGALVGSVEKGSPAERAGDVVVALDEKPVRSSSDLRNRIGMMKVGATVDLTIVRDGSKRHMKVDIGTMPDANPVVKASLPDAKEEQPAIKGATFADLAPSSTVKGVVVTAVEQGSPAARGGLRPDDVVTAVNRKPVKSVEELQAAMKESSRQTALFVRREGQDVLVVVQ